MCGHIMKHNIRYEVFLEKGVSDTHGGKDAEVKLRWTGYVKKYV